MAFVCLPSSFISIDFDRLRFAPAAALSRHFGISGMRFVLLPLSVAMASAVSGTFLTSTLSHAAEADSFVVRDVQIQGLVRLSANSVLSQIPITPGSSTNINQISQAIRILSATGNYDDVQASRDDNTVIFKVIERPVISKITLEGNKQIPDDLLKKGMKSMGLSEGEVLQPSSVQLIKQELEQQYIQQGRYDARVEVTTIARPNNRVELALKFFEGNAAKVDTIRVIGNTVFKQKDIEQAFVIKETSWTSLLTRDDRYAKEKLAASLDKLKALYQNAGYLKFTVNQSQVSLSEDKKHAYIEVNISEGDRYQFGKSQFLGDALFSNEELAPLAVYKAGETYSQAKVTAVGELLKRKYGNSGYYYAEINAVPDVDEATKTVNLNYYINPGKQTYVRRINFSGNTKTADEVLRREMRQMESALSSNEKIDLSKARLERLGYFKNVSIEPVRVPGSADQIDLNVKVEEQPSGTSTVAVGYSQGGGVTFQLGLKQTNFMGTGNFVSMDLSRSQTLDNYNISVTDPYFTIDGVSRGYNVYYRKTKLDSLNVSRYVTDSLGGALSFGYPVDENTDVSASINTDQTKITTGSFASTVAKNFMLANGGTKIPGSTDGYEGTFNTYGLNLSWLYNTLNNSYFATRGMMHRFSLDVMIPGSDIEYQRLSYDGQMITPLFGDYVLRSYAKLGYGHDLPFYKNYFAGGFGSVRGFRNDSLGPRSPAASLGAADPDPEPIGGNVLIQGGSEIVMPLPFRGDWTKQIRASLFAEGGQVYDTQNSGSSKVDLSELRYSVGAGITWITMIGPLSLSYGYPLNEKTGDRVQRVQFEIGRMF